MQLFDIYYEARTLIHGAQIKRRDKLYFKIRHAVFVNFAIYIWSKTDPEKRRKKRLP